MAGVRRGTEAARGRDGDGHMGSFELLWPQLDRDCCPHSADENTEAQPDRPPSNLILSFVPCSLPSNRVVFWLRGQDQSCSRWETHGGTDTA